MLKSFSKDLTNFRGWSIMNSAAEKTNIWNNILQSVEKRLNRQIFDSWFRPIQFEGLDENQHVLRLRASQVNKDWVSTYYSDLISQTLKELNIADYRLDWEIEETRLPEDNFLEVDDEEEFLFEKQRVPQNNNSFNFIEASRPQTMVKPTSTNFVDIEPIENSLNPKYTFQTF